jgi:outer membrane protein OmpA-like peptidoglycan-associated protein
MMKNRQALLLAAASMALFVPSAGAKTFPSHPLILAQATENDAVAAAEAAVEAARAKLQEAMASGQGVQEARKELNDALAALAQARAAAGMPPAGAEQGGQGQEQGQPPAPPTTPPPTEQNANPPSDQTDQNPPPKGKRPNFKPGQGQEQNATPPAPPTTPPPPPPPTTTPAPETTAPPAANQSPPPPPAAEQTAPATTPPPETTKPPKFGKGGHPPAAQGEQPPAATGQQPPPPTTAAPGPTTTPPPEPAITLPPAPQLEAPPPPPPPPAATQGGTFNFQNFQHRPKFGELPPNAPSAPTTPPPPLPKTEDALKNGAVIQAPGGRVIIKDQGQVTVEHDDSGRFVRQGDKVNNTPSDNGTETTTVNRPDGTSIVTVRDRSGNIIQRYRKNPDGSVTVLIGQEQQPGMFGKVFGQRPQLPPPRPLPPPQLNLQLGPLQITIPQSQYIVDSSRANEQQLQQTLGAPPIERVERPYSLEEIERNGRLRDKVRRIDFDTITFDTGQATVPDDQIPHMQEIGNAIRAIVNRDPSTVILIEGHTDAVGSDLSNLALSDRRAETVAQILSYYYGIPPENLVTQGYGEQFLKVPTTAANQENRRVAFRNITSLLRPQG